MSPFTFKGVSIFSFTKLSVFDANGVDPDQTACTAASHLVYTVCHCLFHRTLSHVNVVWFVTLQIRVCSHSMGMEMLLLKSLSEASSSPIYCICKQQRLWQMCRLTGAFPVCYVISTLFFIGWRLPVVNQLLAHLS